MAVGLCVYCLYNKRQPPLSVELMICAGRFRFTCASAVNISMCIRIITNDVQMYQNVAFIRIYVILNFNKPENAFMLS